MHHLLKLPQEVSRLNCNPPLPVGSKCAQLAAVLRSYPLGGTGAEGGQDEK